MGPSPEELAAVPDFDAISDWADLPHREKGAAAPSSPRGSFYMVLGASGTTKPRTTAAIPEKKFAEVIDKWRINDQEIRSPAPSCSHQRG